MIQRARQSPSTLKNKFQEESSSLVDDWKSLDECVKKRILIENHNKDEEEKTHT